MKWRCIGIKLLGLIIVSSLLIIFLFHNTFLGILIMEMNSDVHLKSNEQISECFKDNKADFLSVRELLVKYPYIQWLQKDKQLVDNSSKYQYLSRGGIYVISETALDDNVLSEIDSSGAINILKKLKFDNISLYKKEYISFLQGSSLAEGKGIMYIDNREQFDDKYYNLTNLEQEWFVFNCK